MTTDRVVIDGEPVATVITDQDLSAQNHPAWQDFLVAMKGRGYVRGPLPVAWQFFRDGWLAHHGRTNSTDGAGVCPFCPATEPSEDTLLGPVPLAIEFRLTPAGAEAILGEPSPNISYPDPLDCRVVIDWRGPRAFIRDKDAMGDGRWAPVRGTDKTYGVGPLHLNEDVIVMIAIRRLAIADFRTVRKSPNGGRVIDLGAI